MSLNEQKLKELDFLYKLNILLSKFMMKSADFKLVAKSADKLYKRKDSIAIRGFQASLNDLCEEIQELLSLDDKKSLNDILKQELGITLEQVEHKRFKKIKTIIDRNKIRNGDEFRLILGRVEEIYADNSKKKEVQQLNQLLSDFERTHKPKNE